MAENEPEGLSSPSFAPTSFSMEASDDRFILDALTVSMAEMWASEYTIVHELSDEIDYIVVEGEESWMPDGVKFTPDIQINIGNRSLQETDEIDATGQTKRMNAPEPTAPAAPDTFWSDEEFEPVYNPFILFGNQLTELKHRSPVWAVAQSLRSSER